MRTIVAKWTQPCRKCGKPVMYDTEAIYDDTTKRIYHEACAPTEQPARGDASVELAERLGYRTAEEIRERGIVLFLPSPTGGDTAGRDRTAARGEQDSLWAVPGSEAS